jgi:hypothetical protein
MAESQPQECACDKCGEVELPDQYWVVAMLPEIKRFGETDVLKGQVATFVSENEHFSKYSISPLDLENRFISPIDDLISNTVIIC